ncbi:hypothetical protein [Tychonema bourrellyi]|uniref:hypothetical protein n=1 Tax=Tychonema bourrellyi TaxID=54313 RepID=UPI0015D51917|nr:hypothetical protein [Tychonema bourrellyi]
MPVPQEINCIVEQALTEQARCLFHKRSIVLWNRHRTGKMPVPQEINCVVEQASTEQARCLFHKRSIVLWNRHLACS